MNPDYSDILSRAGEPTWWSGDGVPRYGVFNPTMVNVYSNYVAYIEIACQSCDERFLVAVAKDLEHIHHHGKSWRLPQKGIDDGVGISPWSEIGAFHFGDPPSHACVGDTMNSVPINVIEFWVKNQDTQWLWTRKPEYEISIIPLEE